ncbi:MAG: hypothetical protein KDA87_23225 [Planctomycetales bacterium]|nr:hypothetical protein [Planctomycetales bacterium]
MKKVARVLVATFIALFANSMPADVVTISFNEFGVRDALGYSGGNVRLAQATGSPLSTTQAIDAVANATFSPHLSTATYDSADFQVTASLTNTINLYSVAGGGLGRTFGELNVDYTGSGFTSLKMFDNAPGSHTGDLISTTITVEFANHFLSRSENLTVDYTSGNSSGAAFESTVIQFLNASGDPIGNYSYNGFWNNGVSNLPSTAADVIVSDMVFVAASPQTVDLTDPNSPSSGTSGSNDNANVLASDIVGPDVLLGGFRVISYLEDVALVDGSFGGNTSTNSKFTNSLQGFQITAVPEPSAFLLLSFAGVVVIGARILMSRIKTI